MNPKQFIFVETRTSIFLQCSINLFPFIFAPVSFDLTDYLCVDILHPPHPPNSPNSPIHPESAPNHPHQYSGGDDRTLHLSKCADGTRLETLSGVAASVGALLLNDGELFVGGAGKVIHTTQVKNRTRAYLLQSIVA